MLLPTKVSFFSAALVVVVSAAFCHSASAYPSISPNRINHNILANSFVHDRRTTPLLDVLGKGGVVSITDIPNNFHNVKLSLMSHLHECITSIGAIGAGDGSVIPTELYHDGTVRRSFATSTQPNGDGSQSIKMLEEFLESLAIAPSSFSSSYGSSCKLFKDQLSSFRSTIDSVTKLFANQLSTEMDTFLSQPLLRTSDHAGVDYVNIAQIVDGGVHLEHFHSYQTKKVVEDNNNIEDSEGEGKTIEFHTDQGFFIAFTPGMIVSPTTQELQLSDGFYIQDTTNGERMQLVFTGEDELVFMMGDGVNQL
jgi:hypothetical protein